jgi:hypothetical protein
MNPQSFSFSAGPAEHPAADRSPVRRRRLLSQHPRPSACPIGSVASPPLNPLHGLRLQPDMRIGLGNEFWVERAGDDITRAKLATGRPCPTPGTVIGRHHRRKSLDGRQRASGQQKPQGMPALKDRSVPANSIENSWLVERVADRFALGAETVPHEKRGSSARWDGREKAQGI